MKHIDDEYSLEHAMKDLVRAFTYLQTHANSMSEQQRERIAFGILVHYEAFTARDGVT